MKSFSFGLGVHQRVQIGALLKLINPLTNNYWYDPYLTKPYSAGSMSSPTSYLNWWGTGGGDFFPHPTTDPLGEFPSCSVFLSTDISVTYVGLSFSKTYLNLLGWVNDQKFKCGFYIRFPDATAVSIRRVYLRKNDSSIWQTVDVANSAWTWISANDEVTINDSVLQGYDFGIRFCNAGEPVYITGLTLQNTTLATWKNELLESYLYKHKSVTIQNQYIWEEYIDTESPAYKLTFDQNGATQIKEIVDIRGISGSPVQSDALKISVETAHINRPNIFITNNSESNTALNFELYPINQNVKVQCGCWVKCVGNASNVWIANWIGKSIITNKQNHKYENMPTNQWIWIESLPVDFLAADVKAFSFNAEILQLIYNYTNDDGVFYVTGITWGYVNNTPLNFGWKRYYNISNIQNLYRKIWSSLGDSITAAGNYQANVLSQIGMIHNIRGIGSSTVVNTSRIAWVDANGNYITRPPDSQPVGSTEIDSSMCRQSRIDTIPVDSQLVTILAGINDWGEPVPLGTINDVASDAIGGSFYAAYKSMLNKLIIRCPSAIIVLFGLTFRHTEATPNTNGNTVNDFRQAIINIAELYGIQHIILSELGVNEANYTSYLLDDVHPNYYYHKMIGKQIASELIQNIV